MCITNIAGHGRKANERVRGEGDILQGETVTPFFPCYHQEQDPDQKLVEYAQPFHWTFTYTDKPKVRSESRRHGLTHIQYCVLDVDDLEFCRDVAAAISCLHNLLGSQQHSMCICSYRALSDHIRHTIFGKIITRLPVALHGNDTWEGEVGVDIVFVSMPWGTVSITSFYMEVQNTHVSRKIPIPVNKSEDCNHWPWLGERRWSVAHPCYRIQALVAHVRLLTTRQGRLRKGVNRCQRSTTR